MSESAFPMGSTWRKWDLHVHSPLSILNNHFPKTQDGPDWDLYLGSLEQYDISVLGVTDYFTIEGYKKLLDFKKEGRLSNIDLILPNIEFRLRDTSNDKGINFHVVFSDEVPPNEIEEHFLHELHITLEGHPQADDERDKLKISVMEELGRDLRSENRETYQNSNDLEVGAMFSRIDHEEMSRLLNSRRFRGKYVLVLASDNLPDWDGPANATRRILTQKTDFAFTPNESNIAWFLGQKGYVSLAQYIAEFKSLKPSLHGCDAHRLSEINRPCTKRHYSGHDCGVNSEECQLKFCWIRADPTFEGLKQVLYEPEERVRIQAAKPVSSRHIYTFQNVKISESEISSALSVRETNLPINSGLVAVTGGKGAGKTALVDIVANCFVDRKNSEDKNSFVRRIALDSKPDMQTSLEFTGVDSFSKKLSEDKLIDDIELSYISQGELDTYIEDGSTLYERVKEILFEAATPEQKHDFQVLEDGIGAAKETIGEATTRILQLEIETSESVLNDIDVRLRRAQTELDDLGRQIDGQEISEDEIKKANEIDETLSGLRDKESRIRRLIELLEDAQKIVEVELTRLNEAVRDINDLLESLGMWETTSPNLEPHSFDVERIRRLRDAVDQELRNTLREINNRQEERNSFDVQVAQRADLLEKKRDVQDTEKSFRRELENVDDLRTEMTNTREKRRESFLQMLNSVKQLQAKYTDIIRAFSSKRTEKIESSSPDEGDVLRDIKFTAEVSFKREDFVERAEELFHLKRVTVRGHDSDFAEYLQRCEDFAREDNPNGDAIYVDAEKHFDDFELRERTVKATSLDSYSDLFFANYFSVRPVIQYKDIGVDRLSLGQKATVLMKIYLKHGTNPIIIDSHDDHLDNQFIMEELIPALREAKKYRQIVLVSNNANVVVNSDAEQIIIAEHDEGRISYESGSLENPDIRTKAIKVLEGGKEAFEKRQRKYRMV